MIWMVILPPPPQPPPNPSSNITHNTTPHHTTIFFKKVLACSLLATGVAAAHAWALGADDRPLDFRRDPLRAQLLCAYVGHYACCNGDTWCVRAWVGWSSRLDADGGRDSDVCIHTPTALAPDPTHHTPPNQRNKQQGLRDRHPQPQRPAAHHLLPPPPARAARHQRRRLMDRHPGLRGGRGLRRRG